LTVANTVTLRCLGILTAANAATLTRLDLTDKLLSAMLPKSLSELATAVASFQRPAVTSFQRLVVAEKLVGYVANKRVANTHTQPLYQANHP
jgi:hypothetical protein